MRASERVFGCGQAWRAAQRESKQKERAADATRSEKKERTAGQEKGGNPEEEKENRRACREISGTWWGQRGDLCMKERKTQRLFVRDDGES